MVYMLLVQLLLVIAVLLTLVMDSRYKEETTSSIKTQPPLIQLEAYLLALAATLLHRTTYLNIFSDQRKKGSETVSFFFLVGSTLDAD